MQHHGITNPPRREVPRVVGPMHGMRYHVNSHARHVSYMPSRRNSGAQRFKATGSFRCVVRKFVTCNRHNSSRKGFREKDPGYVGIRANKDLWWDLCTENNMSFGCCFTISVKEKTWQIWQGTHRRGPFCLCPVSYLGFFEND